MENPQVQEKTFNIEFRNIKDMEFLIAPRKQTDFVNIELWNIKDMESLIAREKLAAFANRAIIQSLDRMEREKRKQEAIESLEKLYSMRVKSDESAVDLVRAARLERADQLVANTEENGK